MQSPRVYLNPTKLGATLAITAFVACFGPLAGCSVFVDTLNVLGEEPVRIGVTRLELSPPPMLLPKETLFRQSLSWHLQEPVAFNLMTPRQIRVHLGTNRLKYAMVSPADYAEIAEADTSRILAVPVNKHGKTWRRGLIIVAPDSPIQAVSEVKNQNFHMLNRGDILNQAALGALLEAGIKQEETGKGILGLGLETYHFNSLEVAKSVVFEKNSAGIIDEADYEKWPDKGGSFVLLQPSKQQVRVLGTTVKVPEGPFLASIHNEPDLDEKVAEYLLEQLNQKRLVRASLGCAGFAEPIAPEEYEPFTRLYKALYPPEPEEPADNESVAQETPTTESPSVPRS